MKLSTSNVSGVGSVKGASTEYRYYYNQAHVSLDYRTNKERRLRDPDWPKLNRFGRWAISGMVDVMRNIQKHRDHGLNIMRVNFEYDSSSKELNILDIRGDFVFKIRDKRLHYVGDEAIRTNSSRFKRRVYALTAALFFKGLYRRRRRRS